MKRLCQRAIQIDIRKLVRDGQISKNCESVTLSAVAYASATHVNIDYTACALGGERAWFDCPRCLERCAILYAIDRYACRICHRFAYAMENKTTVDRQIDQALKGREAMGQVEGGIVAHYPSKPKGMHWRTYWRKRAQHVAREDRCARAVAVQFGICGM